MYINSPRRHEEHEETKVKSLCFPDGRCMCWPVRNFFFSFPCATWKIYIH